MNHKDNCDRSSFRYSGSGYNRVKVCACGAEDHAPEVAPLEFVPLEIEEIEAVTDITDERLRQMAAGYYCGMVEYCSAARELLVARKERDELRADLAKALELLHSVTPEWNYSEWDAFGEASQELLKKHKNA